MFGLDFWAEMCQNRCTDNMRLSDVLVAYEYLHRRVSSVDPTFVAILAVLIGLVDIFHVFVSDLAEGGGLSLSWAEWNA